MYQKLIDHVSGGTAQCTRRIPDGAIIPHDPMNRDYQEFLKWCAEGNVPLEADPLPQPEPQPE